MNQSAFCNFGKSQVLLQVLATLILLCPAALADETQSDASANLLAKVAACRKLHNDNADNKAAEIVDQLLAKRSPDLSEEAVLSVADICMTLSESNDTKLSTTAKDKYSQSAQGLLEEVWSKRKSTPTQRSGLGSFSKTTLAKLTPYVINTGNNGSFSTDGIFCSSPEQVASLFKNAESVQSGWIHDGKSSVRNIVIYSHGGLISEKKGLKTTEKLLPLWLANNIYPIHIVWQSGAGESIEYRKADRRAAAAANSTGFMTFNVKSQKIMLSPKLIEAAARKAIAPIWSEMKQNALSISGVSDSVAGTTSSNCGGAILTEQLKEYCQKYPGEVKIHLVGHSAGSIVSAGLIESLTKAGLNVETVTFLAPAIRVDEFEKFVAPQVANGHIKKVTIFNLDDNLERSDLAAVKGIAYKGSLLYLVSRSLEGKQEGLKEIPILGMSKFVANEPSQKSCELSSFGASKIPITLVVSDTNDAEPKTLAKHHGDFDDDQPTLDTVVKIIVPNKPLAVVPNK